MPELTYIAHARAVTPKAYGLQTARMLQAWLDAAADDGLRFLCPALGVTSGPDIRAFYSLRRFPEPVSLPALDLPALADCRVGWLLGPLRPFAGLARTASFALSVTAWLRGRSGGRYFLRDVWLAGLLGGLLGPEFRRSCVVEAHGLSRSSWRRRIQVRILRSLAGVVVLTASARTRLLEYGLNPARVLVAPSGADLNAFAPGDARAARLRLGLPPDRRYAVYAGRLETLGADKGVADLLRAASPVLDRHPDLDILCVGGPEQRIRQYADLIRELRLPRERIIWTGQVPAARIPDYLRAATLLLAPRPERDERFAMFASPLKEAEYAASGRPVVRDMSQAGAVLAGDGRGVELPAPWDWPERARIISGFLAEVCA